MSPPPACISDLYVYIHTYTHTGMEHISLLSDLPRTKKRRRKGEREREREREYSFKRMKRKRAHTCQSKNLLAS